jgi:hypothetical protein
MKITKVTGYHSANFNKPISLIFPKTDESGKPVDVRSIGTFRYRVSMAVLAERTRHDDYAASSTYL